MENEIHLFNPKRITITEMINHAAKVSVAVRTGDVNKIRSLLKKEDGLENKR
jgi:hypothetical protein